jgi:hypothetical protein
VNKNDSFDAEFRVTISAKIQNIVAQNRKRREMK